MRKRKPSEREQPKKGEHGPDWAPMGPEWAPPSSQEGDARSRPGKAGDPPIELERPLAPGSRERT
jgi:hypothetical protein